MLQFGGAVAERQSAWLRRNEDDGTKTQWRPITFYRQGARRWVWHIDNILRHSTAHGGYEYLKFDAEKKAWHHWSTWPWAFIAMDLGADGLLAYII